jgi:hypothetical protein
MAGRRVQYRRGTINGCIHVFGIQERNRRAVSIVDCQSQTT